MANSKKSKNLTEKKHEEVIIDLADRVIESFQEEDKIDLEAFEDYAQRLRSSLHLNAEQFKNRFLKGYTVLRDESKKQS